MTRERTTVAIQKYLDELASRQDGPTEAVVAELLGRAAERLHLLCTGMLHRSYPRLRRHPVNLQATEMLSAVIERMLRALRNARPGNVRQFFQIATQHMRWELNDVARRVDQSARHSELREDVASPPMDDDSTVSPKLVRILGAIDRLPSEEREVFDLVRIQGLTQQETAELLNVSVRTVQRRLGSGILFLSEELSDLRSLGSCPPANGTSLG